MAKSWAFEFCFAHLFFSFDRRWFWIIQSNWSGKMDDCVQSGISNHRCALWSFAINKAHAVKIRYDWNVVDIQLQNVEFISSCIYMSIRWDVTRNACHPKKSGKHWHQICDCSSTLPHSVPWNWWATPEIHNVPLFIRKLFLVYLFCLFGIWDRYRLSLCGIDAETVERLF